MGNGLSQTGQAFLLVTGAGLCTALGASVVFFPSLANLAKPHVLAISLAFASGIMVYISLVDIYTKAIVGFIDAGYDEGKSFIYATLSFFAGCLIMLALDQVVDLLMAWDSKRRGEHHDDSRASALVEHHHGTLCGAAPEDAEAIDQMRNNFETKIAQEGVGGGVVQQIANRFEAEREVVAPSAGNTPVTDHLSSVTKEKKSDGTEDDDATDLRAKKEEMMANNAPMLDTTTGDEGKQLTHMSWAMAASIAIHNFPEGMVTYLAYMSDSAVGIALAIGIAVHNIPEGLCVSMPLYYATGRRFYSFLWGTLSGLTEPLGALLVYLILADGMSGVTNGILFGIVSGMMTVISIDELLPTAHKYAANPKHVTYTFLIGMLFIAASLMLFSV